MPSMSTLRSLLLSQVFAIVFSLVATFAPQYFWVLVIAFMLIIPFTMGYSMLKARISGKYQEIANARKLMEEKNALDIAMRDPKLQSELAKQFKGMMYSFASLPAIIAISILYNNYVRQPYFSDGDVVLRFIGALIMYELFIFTGRTIQYLTSKKTGYALMIPHQYIVTTKGIIGKGVTVSFPLDEYKVEVDYKRRFIQLTPKKPKGIKSIIRLYTKDIGRLQNIMENYGGVRFDKKETTST